MLAKTAASGGPELAPEVLAFTSSLADDRALLLCDVAGSLAHVRMLAAREIIPPDAAAAIAGGLARIADAHAKGTLDLPLEEDVHMAVEAKLFTDIGAPAKMLHAARSRNDQIALDLRLFVRETARTSALAIAELLEKLARDAAASFDVLLPSYTHRQRAQPISLAFLFAGYAEAFARDLSSFERVLSACEECPLGAGASSGTSLPIDRAMVASLLGFARPTASALDTVGDRDFSLDFAFATSKLMTHVSRVATDIVDFSTAEFGFVKLGSAIACGSSMMPQKRNPDLFELLRGKSGAAIGSLTSLFVTMKGLPFGYNRDQQEDRAPLLACARLATTAPKMLALGLSHVTWDRERCRRALAEDVTQATDLAEALVRRGVPFRESHKLVGELVAYCKERGVSLLDVGADAAAIDRRLDADVLAATDLDRAVAAKKSLGGTAKECVAPRIEELRAIASAASKRLSAIESIEATCARLGRSAP